ncbi:MAG: carbonic anhydrase [Clostridiaceae bacterium]|nr:carbonic anhydrase [Clostridiaceae bacterium]
MLEKILEHNRKFVQERKNAGEDKPISGHAQKDVMVFTCMDTRLVELLEPAMGFGRGDIKILKNAGNIIRNNCSDVIRSVAVGTVLMGLKEVYVVGHTDCGMGKQKVDDIKAKMIEKGISADAIEAIDIEEWFGLLKDEGENVKDAVEKLRKSPYIPKDVNIHGLLMDPNTGGIEVIA